MAGLHAVQAGVRRWGGRRVDMPEDADGKG